MLSVPEAGDKVVHCEDAAFRAFRVGTGANTAVIKGFFLLFFFFILFLLSVWCVLDRAMFRSNSIQSTVFALVIHAVNIS